MESSETTRQEDPNDQQQLESMGYRQDLSRSMGSFSSFAISFSLISVLTGIFANFNFGFRKVGGAIIWSWALVAVGQYLIARVMAHLALRFPVAGYGYQWTARLINPHFGFFVGWCLLLQFITGFPGVCQALAVTMNGLTGESLGMNVSMVTVLIITIITLIHLYGIRLVTLVNDLGVYAELIGVAVFIIFIWGLWLVSGKMEAGAFINSLNATSGGPADLSAFGLSLLLGAWCLTGFEAAADLAEETKDPARVVPRAVMLSHLSASVAGFLMLAGLVAHAGDIRFSQEAANPLLFILESAFGPRATVFLGLIVLLSIFACAVAAMAAATRLVFSLARDHILPFSGSLARVHPHRKVPHVATMVIWGLSCLAVLATKKLEIITGVSAMAAFLGYAGIMIAVMLGKTSDKPGVRKPWHQEKIKILAMTGFVWTLVVLFSLTVPIDPDAPADQARQAAWTAAMVMMTGLLLYFTVIRRRIKRGAGPPVVMGEERSGS